MIRIPTFSLGVLKIDQTQSTLNKVPGMAKTALFRATKLCLAICMLSFLLVFSPCTAQRVSTQKTLNAAIESLNAGNEEVALFKLDTVLARQPLDTEALLLRARVLCNRNEFDRALVDYNKLIELEVENKEAWYGRGLTRLELKQYEAALTDFTNCLEMPDKPTNTAYFKMDASGDFTSSINTLRGMDAEIWNHIGLSHYFLHQFELAVQAFNKGLEINDKMADLYVNRALCYEGLNQPDQAIQDNSTALGLDASNATAALNLANIQQSERSTVLFDAITEKNPRQAEAYSSRAMAFYKNKEYEMAESDFRRAMELDTAHHNYALNLAMTLLRLGKIAEAETLLLGLTDKDPRNAAVWFNLGNISFSRKSYDEAVAYYTLAIEADGLQHAAYLYNRGLAFEAMDEIEKACQDVQEAQKIDTEIGQKFYQKYCVDTK
jgi:tetratricopeptide (TPR) repeat protein